ncbi:MAG: class I SAM-dependent methyltransferase [Methanobacteriaceae archaeon]|jgi:ubiquinone/menaquinone biosynthesis C-methylase UbiE|nr:class I SAM-dependent methyltransferase [Methanobacteriaceae archaeon]MDP2836758.1 class I SAM-dependent methyltransferase [Methanobacteriaceae archaeon]MDP3034928.1 class I SAM-dependent methyltransferase [Methanobacteriaceae archaeon]MDP3485356.1 class I SAM-dependent methyltransferase [Methanobacteriaceae archaeon]MDP3622539.1 class I SAM-dependent methyltransferase [Methanobacteriaceae archaeon]
MLTEFRLKMLNREADSPKNKSLEIIKNLNIENGMVVADIGTGGGYFTKEFSRKVRENGIVHAIDINQKALDFISNNLEKESIKNVKTLLANPNGINLPEKSVDLIFLRNAFHHLPEQEKYFKNIKQFLKDDGKIAIIDYKQKGFSLVGLFGHYTPENELLDIMDRAGFSSLQKFDFLPNQLFITFEKKS